MKRKRATLESDPPRDSRVGLRRIPRTRGSPCRASPPSGVLFLCIPSFPSCLINSGGVGAEPPVGYSITRKFQFTLNRDTAGNTMRTHHLLARSGKGENCVTRKNQEDRHVFARMTLYSEFSNTISQTKSIELRP